jgi:hypothetical protein
MDHDLSIGKEIILEHRKGEMRRRSGPDAPGVQVGQ